ncbi:hypothetical protein CQ059_16705 [Brucella pseudogrignonensis]|nr:hypothetical protein CQ059_16705 [Brucella pseudogrignonensis]PRA40390.1 hypothetical protein CQ063_12450 [Brucella pseudogrignonensis]PRA68983.1 hypothetical protein CQ055_12335 [Brucella pseudogrignonensis]
MAFIPSVRDWRSPLIDISAGHLVVVFALRYVTVLQTPMSTVSVRRVFTLQRLKAGRPQRVIRCCCRSRRLLLLLIPNRVSASCNHNDAGRCYKPF